MSRLFYHVMQDNVGNLLFDVSGTMRLAGTGTAATIYGDEALTVIIPNPMTNHPSYGSFKCFLGAGDYDFYMAKSGYTFETLTGVQGHGTMAQQDADNVAITGGTADLDRLAVFSALPAADGDAVIGNHLAIGTAINPAYSLTVGAGVTVTGLTSLADNLSIGGSVGIRQAPDASVGLYLKYSKETQFGLLIAPNDTDGGANRANILFANLAGSQVGSITTTATVTGFNTTSDSRLKHAITPLTGALDVVRRLRPVSFLWNADGSPGRGFLAGEVQDVIPDGVITGDKDAVDEEGQIVPQMIDYSKLVPWLVSACQDLAQQVQALTARLDAAGA